MMARRIVTAALLLFVMGSVGYVAVSGMRRGTSAPEPVASGYIVYFFDMGKECSTCDNIESYAHEAVTSNFAEALGSGALAWRRVDLDEPGNEHFVAEFALYAKAVVLVEQREGRAVRSKNLEAIWDLVYDKAAFIEYVRTNLDAFMKGRA